MFPLNIHSINLYNINSKALFNFSIFFHLKEFHNFVSYYSFHFKFNYILIGLLI